MLSISSPSAVQRLWASFTCRCLSSLALKEGEHIEAPHSLANSSFCTFCSSSKNSCRILCIIIFRPSSFLSFRNLKITNLTVRKCSECCYKMFPFCLSNNGDFIFISNLSSCACTSFKPSSATKDSPLAIIFARQFIVWRLAYSHCLYSTASLWGKDIL